MCVCVIVSLCARMYVCMYVCMHACMYVWMDDDGCMDGWMDGWMYGWMYVCPCNCAMISTCCFPEVEFALALSQTVDS